MINKMKRRFHNFFLKYFNKYISNKSKVFGIGLNKTGTTSLGVFCHTLGFSHSTEVYTAEKIKDFLANDEALFHEADMFDMHEDWPWPVKYESLFYKYPDAKFILTLRADAEQWFLSLANTSTKDGPSKVKKIFYGDEIVGSHNKSSIIEIYKNHQEQVIKFFTDNDPSRLLVIRTNDLNKEELICDFLKIENEKNLKYPFANHRVKSDVPLR
ncbi:hypothetical protein FE810_09025 [Thalassotalea litorea]|uniref:Sulfotransferase family protein n=1 Tax=Thalassotalea litorea TaxID=2020715 RepID=A0A5R9IHP8_9GAMM|nr:sulfotransferase [Thalassotalea litorea]TLU65060.1 hypothetical protein FE810_09025 [Thalassotalea litorea]